MKPAWFSGNGLVDDFLCHLAHGGAARTRANLDFVIALFLAHALLHQHTLGAVDEFARGEFFLKVIDLFFELPLAGKR